MSAADQAVFLSYASQDAEAARRICAALRAAGVEVWFDQNELVGGDAWDQKIRRQIKECALFVPVISVNTNARAEGYFRLEWKLAVDRSHLLADDHPFLFPVVIDETPDATARVPDKFREVQWSRLNVKDTPETLAKRVAKLLVVGPAPAVETGRANPPESSKGAAVSAKSGPHWIRIVSIIGGLTIGLVYAVRPLWSPPRQVEPKPVAAHSAPVSEALQLSARALALCTKVGFTRDDLEPAEELARRATEIEPDSAAAWGVRAGVQAAWLFRGWDTGEKRRQDTQTFANHALALDPNESEALLALGHVLRTQGAFEQAIAHLRRAVAAHPDHLRLVRALGYTLSSFGHEADAQVVLLDILKRAPRDPLLRYELAMTYATYGVGGAIPKNLSGAIEQLDTSIAIQPFSSALILKAGLIGGWRGDLPAMRATMDQLEKLPLAERSEDRSVCVAMWAGLLEHRPDRIEAAAALTARNYFDDFVMPMRPKAWSLALAHRLAGKDNLARNDWQAAETVLRQRLKDDPANEKYQVELAITLAWLGQREEAARLVAPLEPVWQEEFKIWRPSLLARYYAALGDVQKAVAYLAQEIDLNVFTTRKVIPLDPWWDKIRGAPEFVALLVEPKKEPATTALLPDEKSVAVLAFADLSAAHDSEYFSDGISEELLNVLAKVPGLKVTARTSSFHFKGKDTSIPEIAQQLGVAYVVEGSVRKAGDKVRITAQLIKAADGFHVWSDTFTRDLRDIFAVQDEIAGLIAKNLELKIGVAATGRTVDPEAYRLYLEALPEITSRTLAGFDRAEQLIARAIDRDPGLVPAQAALAVVWGLRAQQQQKIFPYDNPLTKRIVAQAEKAVQQGPDWAEAQAACGYIYSLTFRLVEGEQFLRRAIQLNPSYAAAHLWLGRALLGQGRMDEALAALKHAAELDPLSHRALDNYAFTLVDAGRPQEALGYIEQALRIQPDSLQALAIKARTLADVGRLPEALALLEKLPADLGGNLEYRIDVYGRAGRRAELETMLAAPSSSLLGLERLYVLVALGRKEEALALMDQVTVDWGFVDSFLFYPLLDPLRSDPRFLAALQAGGLTEAYARAQAWRAAHPPEKSAGR